MIHDSIQNGNIGWSNTTDLGASIVGSYSFYLLGSPFFWITLLFPSSAVPYLMAPLLMLKFGFAAMFAYLYLKRYVSDQRYAMFGALIYAFSGFGIYNVFFNHFHEAMITFPMMLMAIDMFIFDKRRFTVAFTVFIAAFVNYYFFAGQAVFIFIYWCFRMIFKSYKMTLKEFLLFAFEIISGFLCAGIIVIPSVIAVMQNSRVGSFISGWDGIVYPNSQRYIHIITSFLFPPDMPSYPNFAPQSDANWGSVAAWLPLFSITGVLAFYSLDKSKWLRKLIPCLFIMTLIPVFNSAFQLFNQMYYARWFYMFTLILSLATIIALDNDNADFRPAFIRTLSATLLFALLIGLMPVSNSGNVTFGVSAYPDRFWIWTAAAIISLIIFYFLLRIRKEDKKLFIKSVSLALSAVIVLYSNILIGISFMNFPYKYDYLHDTVMNFKNIVHSELTDIDNVRSDFYGCMDNTPMYWQIPSICSFHSILPESVSDFYNTIDTPHDVRSKPSTELYALRGLLSVKYLFDYDSDSYDFKKGDMPGWELLKQEHNYFIYENQYYIPYGFTYDEYITETQFNTYVEPDDMPSAMLKAIILSDEQAKRYSSILNHQTDLSKYTYTEKEYLSDCEKRRSNACSDFKFENSSFSAVYTADDKDELVFFSIPYDEGWTAEIDGQPAEIEKVNCGFMAVKVPAAKTSRIIFRYHTAGLTQGIIVTLSGLLLLSAYAVICKVMRKKTLQ